MSGIRVATHVHSDWSYDASWGLSDLANAFRRRGYRAILMAEHDRGFDQQRWDAYREACAQTSTDDMLLVPGIEYSDPPNEVHVLVWGSVPFLGEALETDELLRRIERADGLAVLAHPRRDSVLTKLDPEWLRYVIGIELWNRKYDGYAPNREVAELLRERPELLPFASLDFHRQRHFHPLAMVIESEGGVTEDGIIDALRNRRARPTAYRLPALEFSSGPAWPVLREIERARKGGLVQIRRVASLRKRGSR